MDEQSLPRTIQLCLKKINLLYQDDVLLNRTEQIKLRKQALHHYRNQLLSQQLECSLQASDFAQTHHGKPYLKHYPAVAFNHSHSALHYALVSSTSVQDLGVDIEDLERVVRFEALAKHAFHPDEFKLWQQLDYDREYWFKVWTTKEAVLKASGLGIRLNLNTLNTQLMPDVSEGVCQHDSIGTFAYQHIVLANAVCTVAWRSEQSLYGVDSPKLHVICDQKNLNH